MADTQPHSQFYFLLHLGGEPAEGGVFFQEVSGLLAGPPELAEAESPYGHRRPAILQYENLVLRRGLLSRDSALASWVLATLNGNLACPIVTRNVHLRLLDAAGTPLASWVFLESWPVKWSVADFNPQEDTLAVETLEFAYSTFQQR